MVNRTSEMRVVATEETPVFTIQANETSMGIYNHLFHFAFSVNGLATNIPNFIGSDALTYFAFGADVSSVDLEDDWNYYTYSIDTPVGKKDIKLFSPTVDCERLKVIVPLNISLYYYFFSGNFLTICAWVHCQSPR